MKIKKVIVDEMPEGCYSCWLFDSEFNSCHSLPYGTVCPEGDTRHPDCPLEVEVKGLSCIQCVHYDQEWDQDPCLSCYAFNHFTPKPTKP
jgi:hypothetical protein